LTIHLLLQSAGEIVIFRADIDYMALSVTTAASSTPVVLFDHVWREVGTQSDGTLKHRA